MYTSTLLLSLLSATTALALPTAQASSGSNGITVILSNQATELGSQTILAAGKRDEKPPVGSGGPFKTVEISVGDKVKNKDIRCQLLDNRGKPIQARRGQNLDTTFSDADKGEWTFVKDSQVSKIICDPTFKANNQNRDASPLASDQSADSKAKAEIRVLLANQATEDGQAFILNDPTKRQELAVRSNVAFREVTLTAPASAKDLRCQVQDKNGKAVTIQRGQNVDVTFADGGKGKWTFKNPQQAAIGKIICDPAFKKASA